MPSKVHTWPKRPILPDGRCRVRSDANRDVTQVASALAASPEFFVTQGGGTNNGFLNALYQAALGRPIDSAALEYLGQELSAGVSRQQIVAAVFSSDEYLTDVVNGLYEHLLQRAADAGALAYWAEPATGRTSEPDRHRHRTIRRVLC